jgi:hypothetical protein
MGAGPAITREYAAIWTSSAAKPCRKVKAMKIAIKRSSPGRRSPTTAIQRRQRSARAIAVSLGHRNQSFHELRIIDAVV